MVLGLVKKDNQTPSLEPALAKSNEQVVAHKWYIHME